MRTEATLEEWRELYDIAIKLKDLKPWEKLCDLDLITIQDPSKEEPTICSIMGMAGECYAIAAYDGIYAIHNFLVMVDSEGMPPNQLIRYQNNIMCNYGSREELTTKERNIIKELGLKFRGKNNWIYFRTFEEGYAPYMPNKDEVINFTKILNNLYNAIETLNNGLKVDFENGKTLMYGFDETNNEWISSEEDLLIPDMKYPVPVLEDELLVQRLKNQKQSKSILELDIAYLNSTIKDKAYDKPFIARLCVLMDAKRELILSQNMLSPDDSDVDIIFELIINYIIQNGKPKSIVVRDEYLTSILYDLCIQLEIELIQSEQLACIDEFIEGFYKYRFFY